MPPLAGFGQCQFVVRSSVDPALAPQLPRPVSGESIGDRIVKLREERGWKKADLVRRIWPGTPPARRKARWRQLHKWETGVVPDGASLRMLAEALEVKIDELVGVADGQEPPFAAWGRFKESATYDRLTERQRLALAAIWWPPDAEPTEAAYEVLASGLMLAKPKASV